MDLLIIQPGETLGGTWWTYRVHSGPWQTTSYVPEQSTTFMGLILRQDGDPLPDPLVDLDADWLWWEPVAWNTAASASTDLNWFYWSWGPRAERKAETMRKAPPGANSVLSVVTRTDEQNATASFTNSLRFNVAASALVILP